ncbi:TPM domain-containing protein, partial [Escherichia coli]|uniref:TPM domain-containing protein n=1 Tax=Escherichia coli TaxID=562 RepID=UPI003EDECA0E
TKDETIEQYAARVFDNWRLGDAKRNDGILIIVAWEKLEDQEVSLFSILAKTKESDKWGAASSEDLLA